MPLILESLVTTLSPEGKVNLAPMGPEIVDVDGAKHLILRPFAGSTTHANLLANPRAVVHVTDNAHLIAQTAIGTVATAGLVQPLGDPRFWRLVDCHQYFAVEAVEVVIESPRAKLVCRVVDSGVVRPFFGFNRGKHAVIEAAILATRTHLIPAVEIHASLDRLRPLIDKTGGDEEHRAFELLEAFISDRITLRHGTD